MPAPPSSPPSRPCSSSSRGTRRPPPAGRCLAALLLAAALWAEPAAAEPSRGVYAEAGAGATTFVGPKAVYTATGPEFEARVGYDLLSWLSVGVRIAGSSHRATVPPPPSGERFQLYSGGFDLRIGYRYRMVSVFVERS